VLEQFGGTGAPVDPEQPFLLVMQHPVTTEYGQGFDQINATLEAVARSACRRSSSGRTWTRAPRTSPRASGTSASSARDHGFHFFRNLPPEVFVEADGALRVHGRQLVGGPARGLVPRHAGGDGRHAPAGPRAGGRTSCEVGHDRDEIADAIRAQLAHGRYEPEPPVRRRHGRREDRRHTRGRARPRCKSGSCSAVETAPERPV
jgi:hypothetical protein